MLSDGKFEWLHDLTKNSNRLAALRGEPTDKLVEAVP